MAKFCCSFTIQLKTLQEKNAFLKTLIRDQTALSSFVKKSEPDGKEPPFDDPLKKKIEPSLKF